MKYNNHNDKGITLVELVIVTGIIGLIITAIFSFFISNLNTFNRTADHIQVQNNVQTAMNKIVDDIIGGQALVSNENNTVVFQINNNESITYDYDKGDQTLSRRGTPEVIANNITTFIVAQKDSRITITITSRINDSEVTLKNEIYLRNWSN